MYDKPETKSYRMKDNCRSHTYSYTINPDKG
jgi:hypothetical protein